jgi:hypothetical protein
VTLADSGPAAAAAAAAAGNELVAYNHKSSSVWDNPSNACARMLHLFDPQQLGRRAGNKHVITGQLPEPSWAAAYL